jgi:hypothetical protein
MVPLALNKLAHIRTERAVALALWVTLFSALCIYAYFIVSSVIHVMLRQELMVRIQNAEAAVSDLEAEYLARTGQITDTHMDEAGLVEIASVTYVPLAPDTDRLSRLP